MYLSAVSAPWGHHLLQPFWPAGLPSRPMGQFPALSPTGLSHPLWVLLCWSPCLGSGQRLDSRPDSVWDNSSQNQPLLFVISSRGSAIFCSFWPPSALSSALNSPDFSTSVSRAGTPFQDKPLVYNHTTSGWVFPICSLQTVLQRSVWVFKHCCTLWPAFHWANTNTRVKGLCTDHKFNNLFC